MIMAAIMLLEVQQRESESPGANIDPEIQIHSKLQDVEIK